MFKLELKTNKLIVFLFIFASILLMLRSSIGPNIKSINIGKEDLVVRCIDEPSKINTLSSLDSTKYDFEIYSQDLYISEDIKNIFCYGFIGNIEIIQDQQVIKLFYNSSLKIFSLLNNLINFLLILSIFLKIKFNRFAILISYYILNYLNFDFFIPVVSKSFIFLPFLEFNYFETSLFINSLFLSLFISRSTNNKIFLIGFILHLLFLVDFLPIFIISKILQNKLIFNFNDFERKVFIALPVIYYIVKIISSLTSKLDFFWLYTSQAGFRGLSRYPDLQLILFNLSCKKGKYFNFNNEEGNVFSCDDFMQGSFNFSLLTNISDANVVLISIIVFNFFIILWIFIYFEMLKKMELNEIFVVILSVSTPFIFLISQGNDDFLGLVISMFCIYDLRKYTFLKLLILTITSLLIIHSGFLLFAIFLIALFIKDYNVALRSSIFNVIFAFFILYNLYFSSISILNNKSYQSVFPDMGFGIILDTDYLSSNTGINQLYILLILLISLFFIYRSNYLKALYSYIDKNAIKSLIYQKENIYFLSIPIYFIFVFIFSNVSYRLPIFFVFFILILTYSKTSIRILILLFLLLEPLIKGSPIYFSIFTTILSTASGYFVLCITLKLLIDLANSYKYYVET